MISTAPTAQQMNVIFSRVHTGCFMRPVSPGTLLLTKGKISHGDGQGRYKYRETFPKKGKSWYKE